MTETTQRPLVTFAVIAYNQEQFIREAIEGAFTQTWQPLEIILSDDGSTDRTFEIMREMAAAYGGPHKVVLNRNEPNLGLASHFNRIMEKAEGEFVVVNAGDDISFPERTAMTVQELLRDRSLTYVETQIAPISEDGASFPDRVAQTEGQTYSIEDFIHRRMVFHGAARTYRKSTILSFPPLNSQSPTEDTTSLLRALLRGNGVVLPQTGLKWRVHERNLSSAASLKRMPILKIYEQYKSDINFLKKSSFLTNNKSRKILGHLAYWIVFRVSNQEDKKLESSLDKIMYIFRSSWLNIFEKFFILEAIILRRRLKK